MSDVIGRCIFILFLIIDCILRLTLTWVSMLFGYAEFSQTLIFYFLLPLLSLYVCYVLHYSFGAGDLSKGVLALKSPMSLNTLILVYLSFVLPTTFVFYTFKGFDLLGLTALGGIVASSIKCINALLVMFVLTVLILTVRSPISRQPATSLDSFYVYIFLCLAWFFVSLSTNVLVFLLALELVTTLLLILMCTLSLNLGYAVNGSARFAPGLFGQTQHSLVSTVLSFVWLMGFATIFFLWAVALSFPVYNSIDFFYINTLDLNWKASEDTTLLFSSLLSGGWLGFALLFKLMVQPFQVFLTIFYRHLPTHTLLAYFQFYYVYVLFFIFFFVVTPFGFISIGWHCVVFFYTASMAVLFFMSVETLRDVNTVLAYSTFANLSFFFVIGGYHSI